MIKNNKLKLFVLLMVVFMILSIEAGGTVNALGEEYEPTWESLDKRPIPQWFSDAKFGIFIHWGVYSVPAWRKVTEGRYASYAEWYYARVMENEKNGGAAFHRENYGIDFEYRGFGPMFKAELFDPDFWADLFARSGAKYVVLTSKHHDGYCLWPTKSPYKKDWNSMAVGPKRDLVGDLTRAVRKKGLRMGLYYSIIEWIYGTRPWKQKAHKKADKKKGIYYTRKGKDLYVICTSWPEQPVRVEGFKAVSVSMLGLDEPVKWKIEGDKTIIQPPLITPAQVPSRYAYVFKLIKF